MTTPAELRAEANRLAALQRKERGTRPWEFQDKKTKAPGPYVPTPENESRAQRIVALRKQAARIEAGK